MNEKISFLEKHRDFILLMELLGLIHDIGKYYEGVKIRGRTRRPPAYHNIIGGLILNIKQFKNDVLLKNGKVLNSKGSDRLPIELNSLPFRLTSFVFNKPFSFYDEIIPDCWKGESGFTNLSLGELLLSHHSNGYWYGKLIAEGLPEEILSKADSLDSAEDREGANDRKNRLRRGNLLTSPFGIPDKIIYRFKREEEEKILNNIAIALEKKQYQELFKIKNKFKEIWDTRPADTRAPINDTMLWNHAYMVASIFKAVVSNTVIQGELIKNPDQIPNILTILSIQSPNRDFLTNVYRLPDYNGRKTKLDKIREEINNLIEFKYPLGNCVYEDINGQYFLIPDLENDLYTFLKNKIIHIFTKETEGLLLPVIQIIPCKIQKGERILHIGRTIIARKKEYDTNMQGMTAPYSFREEVTEPKWVKKWKYNDDREICHVCHKMPAQEEEHIFYHDKTCQWCGEQRKVEPARPDEAKFINEIMDSDKRFALLVGEVGLLDQWFNGDYIRTTFVKKDGNLPKPTSPSRMMRIWEEIDRFDKSVINGLKQNVFYCIEIPRLKLSVKYDDTKKANKIYTHELCLKDSLKSQNDVVSEDSEHKINFINFVKKFFIKKYLDENKIIDNKELKHNVNKIIQTITYNGTFPKLELLIKKDSAETTTAYTELSLGNETTVSLINIIESYLKECWKSIKFEFTDDRGQKTELLFEEVKDFQKVKISKVKTIYSYSGEFMYLVPADRALLIANELRKEFDCRYAKVKGRLCLNLGLVYADHKYPLYMILDAGKRMLREFKVANKLEENESYKLTGTDGKAFGIVAQCSQDNGNLVLNFTEHIFQKEDQALLRDSSVTKLIKDLEGKKPPIPDNFYPYLLKKVNEKGVEPIHINEINDNDKILFAPGVFDFEWLDSSKARVNLTLKRRPNNQWRKRDNIFPLIYTRPYRIDFMKEICDVGELMPISEADSGTLKKPTSTALEKFRENLASQIVRWFQDKEDFPTKDDRRQVETLAWSMLQNMEGFKVENSENNLIEKLKDFNKTFEIFDLLELTLFLKAFDWHNKTREGGNQDEFII